MGTTIIGITRNIHGTRSRDTLHSGSLRQHRTNVAEISMLPICIAKIRDGQFVTFSNAFASDSRVAGAIRDGVSPPFSPPRARRHSTEFNVSLSHGVETRDTVRNYDGGDGVTYDYGFLRDERGELPVASCPGGDEARNSFIIERVSGAEVFDGISVFR